MSDGSIPALEKARRMSGQKPLRYCSLDYETFSESQLVGINSVGIWNYVHSPSTEALMVAYNPHGAGVRHVDLTREPLPAELMDMLLDDRVEKWAFNAAFERLVTRHVLKIDTPTKGWRCTMGLANLQSFTGDLLEIGTAMGFDPAKLKDKEGSRLIKLFSMPQRITKKNPHLRRDGDTDPDDWRLFCDYNSQDVVAEDNIRETLRKFKIHPLEWELYELDQDINDRGMPVNREFARQAEFLSTLRKEILLERLRELTKLQNPNSTPQLLPWLIERGYGFTDLQKNTVQKELLRDEIEMHMEWDAVKALKLRQNASRTSVRKYPAIIRRLASDDRLRHAFQFAGAARTARWAGRGPQPHNLPRTPKMLEAEKGDASKLEKAADLIEAGVYYDLEQFHKEPMTILAGSVRSSFQAPAGWDLVVCDLSAIESAVLAWLSGCERLLNVFRTGLDPYRDFGTELYGVSYDAITSAMRSICKPAVLGCGYQLGGGTIKEGKKTGLWGYAENMGVAISQEEAKAQVALFRDKYSEIPEFWSKLDNACRVALIQNKTVWVNNLLQVEMKYPYLTITLPSGRVMYYYKPRIIIKEFEGEDGKVFTRKVMSYMGKQQNGRKWMRIGTSGGKFTENVVQAVARDILAVGMVRADRAGFDIVGHVHDEIVTLVPQSDARLSLDLLRECMRAPIPWAEGLPLGAAGYRARIYRKD